MKKILSLTILVFMLLGLTMSFALQPVDNHQHNCECQDTEVISTTSTPPGIPEEGTICPGCGVGMVRSDSKEATCTEDGYTRLYGSYCKFVFVEETYPALGHNWVWQSYGYYKCTRCGLTGYLY